MCVCVCVCEREREREREREGGERERERERERGTPEMRTHTLLICPQSISSREISGKILTLNA